MKIKCPSCGATGRIPTEKVPATGANIRCPACAFVFFVGGPNSLNVDDGDPDASRLPEARATQTLPADITEQVRRMAATADSPPTSASDAGTEPPEDEDLVGTDDLGGEDADEALAGLDDLAAGAPPVSSHDDVSGPGASGLSISSLGASGLGESGLGLDPGEEDALRALDEAAAAAAAAPLVNDALGSSGLEALDSSSPGRSGLGASRPGVSSPGTSQLGAPRRFQPWKVRSDGGMVYEFPDSEPARKWLATRGSFDDLEASRNGHEWEPIQAFPEFSDVKPGGLRSRSTTGSMRAVPIEEDVQAVREEARTRRTTTSTATVGSPEPTRSTPRATGRMTKAEKAAAASDAAASRKLRQGLLGILLVMSIVVAVLYFTAPPPDERGLRLPNTAAGRHTDWVVRMIDGGTQTLTADQVQQLFSPTFLEQIPAQDLVEYLRGLDQTYDTLRITRFEGPRSETQLTTIVATPTMHRGRISIRTESAPPHRIESLMISSAN